MKLTGWKTMMKWRGTTLYAGRCKMLSIVRDNRYPQMWRVRLADGSLTDMVNQTRAKDAAMAFADRALRLDGMTQGAQQGARFVKTDLGTQTTGEAVYGCGE